MTKTPFAYPYREDCLLLWDAIGRLVRTFVELTYPTEAALQADQELHAYLAEAGSPEGGNVRELLKGSTLADREELIAILTQVLFTAGPMHSLFHYSSATELRDMDQNPSFLLDNPLVSGLKALPGLKTISQYTRVVGTDVRYDAMGDFSQYPFGRRAENQPMIARYQADLAQVEATINERNRTRYAPFVHFLPSRISNGITV